MNYRHIYHAGGFADVFKHIVLMRALVHLRLKEAPFFVLDTHAGTGLYDLDGDQARKTAESDQGIGRLWGRADLPGEVNDYINLVRATDHRNRNRPRFYPGSPLIVREMLRDSDRLVAGELHPEDSRTLISHLGKDRRIRVEESDGYQLVKALLPPPERRGLVLIDPPFEVRDEFERMEKAVKVGTLRWATGTYALWYPIKDVADIGRFHKNLAVDESRPVMAIDFFLQEPADPAVLNGCGMVLINPPWTLREQMGRILPELVKILTDGRGRFDIRTIAGEG